MNRKHKSHRTQDFVNVTNPDPSVTLSNGELQKLNTRKSQNSFSLHFFRLFHPRLEYISYICSEKRQYYPLMLDRTQTIEKLKATRQYFNEHYSVHSMTLLGSLARNKQRKDSDVDICVEMVPNLFNQAGVKMLTTISRLMRMPSSVS